MLRAMHILIIPGLQMPEVSEGVLEQVRAAAGTDATITVADSYGEALEAIPDADVLLGRVDPPLFAAARRLRWVHATTAGADAYLFEEMRDSSVVLSGDKGLVGSHLAETAFGLLLAISRRIVAAVLDGPDCWEHRVEYRRQEFELEGLTMGIVGFGGTGKAIARRAAAFGMHCLAVDPHDVGATPEVPEVWPVARLDELLATSDVVASGLPLTPDTHHLFDERAFSQMKPGAIFINVTRGEVFDADALVRAVESGHLGGAGLDVAPEEPLPADHALWTTRNVVMTPHTAGASQLRLQRNLDRFCRNLPRFLAGEPLEGAIDKQAGF
ncbi:MAG: D-2-hydroxyacid dehydrogenase [Dehalococcoidia bacterium]|nr:D-2-hydroxyacid dehydrogenase [Dehalococcoidia bacterium]